MALPPNWARYTTDDGKEYFHHAITNTTQWEKPEWSGQVPESLSFHSGTSEVYQYRPTVSDLELNPRLSDAEGRMVAISGQLGSAEPAGKAPGGKVPTTDSETVSLHAAPGGRVGDAELGGGAPAPAIPAAPSSGGFGAGGMLGGGVLGGVIAAASAEDGADRMQGYAGWVLSYAQQFFAVSSDDVIKRLRLSMTPYPLQPVSQNAVNEFRERPDFWGPFWIATTAVLFLAATGNFARLLQMGDHQDFKADYSLVSLAASMIYGCLLGVPAITRAALYISGEQVDTVNFRQMICVYGYSLTPAIPVSLVCLVPLEIIRWLAVLAGLGVSLAFIRGNLWTDLVIEAPSLKWKLISLFAGAQAAIFLVYRVHFF